MASLSETIKEEKARRAKIRAQLKAQFKILPGGKLAGQAAKETEHAEDSGK